MVMSRQTKSAVGSNAGRSRTHNRRVVLGQMRIEGQIGRAELARRTGLSTQAVSNIIAELETDGLIEVSGKRSVGRGLPALQFALRPEGGFALGFEIRPDAVFVVLLDLHGEELFSQRRGLALADPGHVLHVLRSMRDAALTQSGIDRDRLLGAGVVMPGPFDLTGVAGKSSELPGWQGLNTRDHLQEALNIPVRIENDANAAAMAERVGGVAQDLHSYAFLYFGTGLGLGVVSDGRLERGAHGNAGEIGHIPVQVDGRFVPLEDLVSRLSLRDHMAHAGKDVTEIEDLDALFKAANPALLAWLDRAAQALSPAVAMIENLFDPQTIILGGAMPDPVVQDLIRKTDLPKRSVANRQDRPLPRLMLGGSGRMTATRGAAALVINNTFTPQIETASQ